MDGLCLQKLLSSRPQWCFGPVCHRCLGLLRIKEEIRSFSQKAPILTSNLLERQPAHCVHPPFCIKLFIPFHHTLLFLHMIISLTTHTDNFVPLPPHTRGRKLRNAIRIWNTQNFIPFHPIAHNLGRKLGNPKVLRGYETLWCQWQ